LTSFSPRNEESELGRDDDHGASGVAGDGEAITCEDIDEWRREPTRLGPLSQLVACPRCCDYPRIKVAVSRNVVAKRGAIVWDAGYAVRSQGYCLP
jgi:hypothetical protein